MSGTWWETPQWRSYERAYGDKPGTRAALLADADFSTRIVDLAEDHDTLWADVRKSYHSIINGLDRDYPENGAGARRRRVVTSGAGGMVSVARRLHREAAGRDTRPESTWGLMEGWVEKGNGLLVLAYDGSPAAYSFWVQWRSWAYYASAATLERDLGLGLIWWGMLALRGLGVRWAETGWQGEAEDEKGKDIEFVRRGFGGRDVPAHLSGRPLTSKEWEAAAS